MSPKYLPMVWQILHDQNAVGPVLKLQKMWLALPPPAAAQTGGLRAKCVAMRDFVVKIRAHTAMQFAAPVVAGLPGQSEPLLNWKLKQFAEHRRDSDPKDLRNDTDPPPVVPAIPRYPKLHEEAAPRWAALSAKARANDTDLIVPAAQRARYEAAFARFASVFPDAFYVTERGRYFPDDSEDKGRLLSAGYHNTMGYYRDDLPLMQLILDDNGKKELDRLWNEFDYIADYLGPHLDPVLLQPERRSFWQRRRIRLRSPDRSRGDGYRSHLQDCATPTWPRPQPIQPTTPQRRKPSAITSTG